MNGEELLLEYITWPEHSYNSQTVAVASLEVKFRVKKNYFFHNTTLTETSFRIKRILTECMKATWKGIFSTASLQDS